MKKEEFVALGIDEKLAEKAQRNPRKNYPVMCRRQDLMR